MGSVSARPDALPPQMSGDKGISAFPESDNLFKWIGTIDGAAGTVRGEILVWGQGPCPIFLLPPPTTLPSADGSPCSLLPLYLFFPQRWGFSSHLWGCGSP